MRTPSRTASPCLRAWLVSALVATGLPGLASAQSAQPSPAPTSATSPASSPSELPNERDPLPGVRTGGAPKSSEGFSRLAREGFVTYIDLRVEPDLVAATRSAAEAAGMTYVQIPVNGDADLDLGAARALDAILDDPARTPVVLACASGNRSGALLAVRAFWLDGKSADEALALGKAGGLTRLEPSVRQLLGLPPPPAPAPPPPPAPRPSGR